MSGGVTLRLEPLPTVASSSPAALNVTAGAPVAKACAEASPPPSECPVNVIRPPTLAYTARASLTACWYCGSSIPTACRPFVDQSAAEVISVPRLART